jgi:hypothetical protein
VVGQTRGVVKRRGPHGARVTPRAVATRGAMHEVAKRLGPQLVQWRRTGGGATHPILHAGVPQARAIVRTTAGKKGAVGLPSLLSRRGGGSIFGPLMRGIGDESTMPLKALAGSRAICGPPAPPSWWSTIGAARPRPHGRRWPTQGSPRLASSPKASERGTVPRTSVTRSGAHAARPKASLGP